VWCGVFFFFFAPNENHPKKDYSAFLYLLRSEAQILGKALMTVPYGEMDYVVQVVFFLLLLRLCNPFN